MASTTKGYAPDVVTALDADGLDRGVGFLGLLWASETSIIGSGWLFGALTAACWRGRRRSSAGSSARSSSSAWRSSTPSWAGCSRSRGGTSRFPHYAFGSFAGATFGWASYLQAASVAPIEVLAAIQYLSTAHWARNFYVKSHALGPGTLSNGGIAAAIILMVIFVILNLVGIRWLARINNAITSWKVIDPAADGPGPAHRALPQRQLRPRRRRLLRPPERVQDHPADASGGHHLLAAGLRAGAPAGR